MFVVIQPDAESVARYAYGMVRRFLQDTPRCVLGLAAGSTPLMLYREMIQGHRKKEIDFSEIRSFNLDEYAGLSPCNPLSFRHFMKIHLFDGINIKKPHIHFLNGIPQNITIHCRQYEEQIKTAGGITLQVLGLGVNGHIGFNEPGSSLSSRTRMTALTPETIKHNKRFFAHHPVPRCALTMGVGTILEAKQIILLATGRRKAEALAGVVEGPVTAMRTASALQLHPDVTVLCDEKAAKKLRYKKYYRRAFSSCHNGAAGVVNDPHGSNRGQNGPAAQKSSSCCRPSR